MKPEEERRDTRSHVRTALYETNTGTRLTGGIPHMWPSVSDTGNPCQRPRIGHVFQSVLPALSVSETPTYT